MPNSANRTVSQIAATVPLLLQAMALVAVLCTGAAAAQDAVLAAQPLRPLPQPSFDMATVSAPQVRQVDLLIDFAEILRIEGDVSVIVLGNANIADASVIAAGTIVLTGKAVGTTNVVVMRPDGGILSEFRVQVGAHKPGAVTVRRGLRPSSYACTTSSCQRADGGSDTGTDAPATQ